ncbi:hypothetical protein, partial [Gardnerella vaginalis]|uniref:hypothetical protein n=1 Tax=Gardnerella vaginalis TaxID=2702 RepID=UPI001E3EBAD1
MVKGYKPLKTARFVAIHGVSSNKKRQVFPILLLKMAKSTTKSGRFSRECCLKWCVVLQKAEIAL